MHPRVAAVAVLALSAVLTTACTAVVPAWHEVRLPPGVQPSVIEPWEDTLLVGGQDVAGPRSVLLRVADDGTTAAVPLRAWDPNAARGDIVRLSAADRSLTALSVTRSGAHGSQRWSVWQGDPADGLADQPQEFFTFHGHDAGPLLALARSGDGPVIIGTHGSRTGFEVSLWKRSGTVWTRHPATDPDVMDDPRRVLVVRSASSAGTRLLLAGAVVDLAAGVRQSPAVWVGDASGSWQRIDLPLPDPSGDPGGLAQATSVACPDATGSTCWAAGWVHGRPVAWEVSPDGIATASVLQGTPPDGVDPSALVALTPAGALIAPNASSHTLALRCQAGWRSVPAPDAEPVLLLQAARAGLYAITGTDTARTLWRTELPGC